MRTLHNVSKPHTNQTIANLLKCSLSTSNNNCISISIHLSLKENEGYEVFDAKP